MYLLLMEVRDGCCIRRHTTAVNVTGHRGFPSVSVGYEWGDDGSAGASSDENKLLCWCTV